VRVFGIQRKGREIEKRGRERGERGRERKKREEGERERGERVRERERERENWQTLKSHFKFEARVKDVDAQSFLFISQK
jgi:hypothetical protein